MKAIIALAGLACALLVGFAGAGDSKKDLDLLQGNWKVTSIKESDGKNPADDVLQSLAITVKGDEMRITSKGDLLVVFKMKLDASKNPKTIDLLREGDPKDPDKGKTDLGIYKIDGDTVTFCSNLPGLKDRPTEFATKEKTAYQVAVLKKAK